MSRLNYKIMEVFCLQDKTISVVLGLNDNNMKELFSNSACYILASTIFHNYGFPCKQAYVVFEDGEVLEIHAFNEDTSGVCYDINGRKSLPEMIEYIKTYINPEEKYQILFRDLEAIDKQRLSTNFSRLYKVALSISQAIIA